MQPFSATPFLQICRLSFGKIRKFVGHYFSFYRLFFYISLTGQYHETHPKSKILIYYQCIYVLQWVLELLVILTEDPEICWIFDHFLWVFLKAAVDVKLAAQRSQKLTITDQNVFRPSDLLHSSVLSSVIEYFYDRLILSMDGSINCHLTRRYKFINELNVNFNQVI